MFGGVVRRFYRVFFGERFFVRVVDVVGVFERRYFSFFRVFDFFSGERDFVGVVGVGGGSGRRVYVGV